MPEFRYAKGRIIESVQFIAGELREFEQDYATKTRQDYENDKKLQKLIDRTVENILTALIEVSGTILVQDGIPVENYAHALGETAKRLSFSQDEQDNLAKLALQRNRLAHRYLNFRWQSIEMVKKSRPLISKFLERVLEREKKF